MNRNDIKKLNKMNEDLNKRMIKGMQQIGDRNLSKEEQKKFEKIINPNHQNEMIIVEEIIRKYPNIPLPFFNVQMEISGFVQKIGKDLFPKKPYTDFYLVPVFQNGDFIGSNAILVASKVVEENIKEFAEKELYKDWRLEYKE